LSGPDGVAAFATRAPETDILVNNLGIFEPKPFDAITDAIASASSTPML